MKVLIVDDSKVFQSFFRITLQNIPEITSIQIANHGIEALLILDALEIDLVILDLEMPKMDGYETLEKIKSKFPNQQVIVCSGKTLLNFNAIQRVIALGADGIVSKSYQKGNITQLSPVKFKNELVPRILKMAKNKKFRSPHTVLQEDYCKEITDGILIIHLVKKNIKLMDYETGNIEDGFRLISSTVKKAAETSTPIFIDNSFKILELIDPLKESLKGYDEYLYSSMSDVSPESTSMDWVHNALGGFIRRHAIGNLMICGFNRSFCVANAAQQISKYYGINVIIAKPLVFGHVAERRDATSKKKSEIIVNEFEKKYIVYETMEAILQSLEANANEKKIRRQENVPI